MAERPRVALHDLGEPQELRSQLDTGLPGGTDIDLEPDLVVVDPEVDDAALSPTSLSKYQMAFRSDRWRRAPPVWRA